MTNEPLTDEQKVLGSGQVLPSGESNFYDYSQDHSYNDGSGINVNFPSPSNFIDASGTIRTYAPSGNVIDTSGIFAASGLKTSFSNSMDAALSGITDFTIFNKYIHHTTGVNSLPVQIPYLQDYTISNGFNPYGI
tara:strand:- start:1598 stop:2002 length:405 start_codon:yes stop_codon:yes gene_type:complete